MERLHIGTCIRKSNNNPIRKRTKLRKIKIAAVFVILLLQISAFSDSLWNERSISKYTSKKQYNIGDVIMVLVVESTSAVQKAGTDTSNQDSLGVSLSHTIDKLQSVLGPSNSIQAQGNSNYKGSGSTNRSSNVLATITAIVTEVLPNGNVAISGNHKITVNEEIQEINIKGIVRTSDVTAWNTIYSYQVANPVVSVKGTGSVGEASSPGLFMRILNFLF